MNDPIYQLTPFDLILCTKKYRQTIPTAEQDDDKSKDSSTPLPSTIKNTIIENNDDKPASAVDVPEIPKVVPDTTISAIANNNNDSTTNGINEAKTNGNCVLDVNASAVVAGKNVNKKKNKKGKECDTAA